MFLRSSLDFDAEMPWFKMGKEEKEDLSFFLRGGGWGEALESAAALNCFLTFMLFSVCFKDHGVFRVCVPRLSRGDKER